MNLIEKFVVDNHDVYFYDGIDIEVIKKHPSDGTAGFIFCFIDSWVETIKNYERESKIDSLLNNKVNEKFNIEHLDNSFLSIYQMSGTEPNSVYNIVKQKVLSKSFLPTWIPIGGITDSVWKIENSKILN